MIETLDLHHDLLSFDLPLHAGDQLSTPGFDLFIPTTYREAHLEPPEAERYDLNSEEPVSYIIGAY